MGKRGPPPTPTKILASRGSWRADRRGHEPSPLSELPEPPQWLPDGAREQWHNLGPILLGMGLMSEPYSMTLAATVEAIDTYLRRVEEAKHEPLTYTHMTGGIREHPIHKMVDRARAEMKRMLALWGLSPADVASVSKTTANSANPLERFGLNDPPAN